MKKKIEVGDEVISLPVGHMIHPNRVGYVAEIIPPNPGHFTHRVVYSAERDEEEWMYEEDMKKLTKLDKALK